MASRPLPPRATCHSTRNSPRAISEYDTKAKIYNASGQFTPLFDYSQGQVLAALCHGLGDDYVGVHRALITAETPTQLNLPQLDVLSIISRAIYQKKAVHVQYRSLSSGQTSREIVPFAPGR
ncbi:hypothetical protein HAALTHF_10380n [Vreelandella aquamarina]|nr:hypothetical protein HAALTHF_10380n [Halomonas axialensis]